jgi:hypothetical protein
LPVSGRGAEPASPAQQCAECIYSYKGLLPEELTLESIRRRAAEGSLPCIVGMSPPTAGSCPSFRPLAPDGGNLPLCGEVVGVDDGILTIEVY